MRKSERLNQELIFLSDRKYFNLFELMSEFNISKRTALRDIKELEYLGMPIYSESGKNGGYRLTHQSLLSPIYFTQKEVYAIFFAFQLLNLIHITPFEHSYRNIYKKFLSTFSEERKIDINKTSSTIRYVASPLLNIPNNLKNLYEIILDKKAISFYYIRYKHEYKLIQPVRLEAFKGSWYCIAMDINKYKWRTYRCDFMEDINIQENCSIELSDKEIAQSYYNDQNKSRNIEFEAKINNEGRDLFLTTSYPFMKLVKKKHEYYIVGKINKFEMRFVAQYLLSLGTHIIIISPDELKKEYTKILNELLQNYN